MKDRRRLLIGLALAASIAWLGLSEPAARLVSGWLEPWRPLGPLVGHITELNGTMKTVRDGRVENFEGGLKSPLPIFSGDRIELNLDSKATLKLNSDDELVLNSMTAAALQLWNEHDLNSAIYINLINGTTDLKKPGIKGKAYLVREGRLYFPGQQSSNKPLALTVLKSAPLDLELASNENSNPTSTPPAPDFEAQSEEDLQSDKKDFGAMPETLSNEYIDDTISSRQDQLQKCWLAHVKMQPSSKAKLVVQFEISRRGKVKEVRLADSSSDDETFKNCVSQVFERLNFRAYKGSEIALSYPISFE